MCCATEAARWRIIPVFSRLPLKTSLQAICPQTSFRYVSLRDCSALAPSIQFNGQGLHYFLFRFGSFLCQHTFSRKAQWVRRKDSVQYANKFNRALICLIQNLRYRKTRRNSHFTLFFHMSEPSFQYRWMLLCTSHSRVFSTRWRDGPRRTCNKHSHPCTLTIKRTVATV